MSASNPTRASNQVLVRLPNDLAERLATLVPARSRSRFLIELLRRELERESHQLSLAAKRLTDLEAQDASLATEAKQWAESALVTETDNFDQALFERQFRQAQGQISLE